MSMHRYARRNAILEYQSLTTDTGGGQAISGGRMWTQVAILPIYLDTSSSSVSSSDYDRETMTDSVSVNTLDALPKKVNGFRTLSDAMKAGGFDRYRILYRGRTLSPSGVTIPNDKSIGPKIVSIACVETPQPVGGMDFND